MLKPSITDGLRCDTAGRLWCSVGWGDPNEDGVRCCTPDGDLSAARVRSMPVYTSAQGALKP
jgi:sugar lactone lactonase YvrE